MTAATFRQQMESKLGHSFSYHALAGGPCPTQLTNAHFALADLMGGEKYPICDGDFADNLADLEDVLESSAVGCPTAP